VLQLSFPSDHADLMGRYLPQKARKDYEFSYHPIRTRGRPTLAWARLDIDLSLGEALIEEVQSDWLRDARVNVARLRDLKPRSRALAALERYEAGLVGRYGRIWPRALMLAALVLIRDEFACRTVWMHQPGAGELFKGMEGAKPPRSLYTALPKSFCFAPVRSWPGFLKRLPNRRINRLPDSEPLFWRLEFST